MSRSQPGSVMEKINRMASAHGECTNVLRAEHVRKLMNPKVNCYLFIGYMTLLAASFGAVLSSLSATLHISSVVLFLVGAALTPTVLGFWTLLLTEIRPKWTPWLLTAVPLLVAGLWGGGRLYAGGVHFQMPRLAFGDYAGLCAVGIVFLLGCRMFFAYARTNNIHHDANAYMDMARYISENRDVRSLCNITSIFPNFVSEPHGASYPAYLAFAQNFMTEGTMLERQCTINSALQLNNIFYFLSAFAAGLVISGSVWAACGVVMLAFVPRSFHYAVQSFSRDAYRLNMAACLLVFLASAPTLMTVDNAVPYVIALFVFCYLVGDAHALNVLLLGCAALGWIVAIVFSGDSLASTPMLVLASLSCGAGMLLSLRKYIHAYLKTGQFMGNIWRRCAFKGTPHETYMKTAFNCRLPSDSTSWKRKLFHVFKGNLPMTALGVLASVGICAFSRHHAVPFGVMFTAATSLILLLPFTGVLDIGPYQFSDFFVSNIRYPLHWYPIAMITASSAASLLTPPGNGPVLREGVATLVVILAFWTAMRAFKRWGALFCDFKDPFFKGMKLFEEMEKDAPWDGSIAVSNTGFPSPFLSHRIAYLFSEAYFPLLRADTIEHVERLIRENNISFFVFWKFDIEQFKLKAIPLYQALQRNHVEVYQDRDYEIWGELRQQEEAAPPAG